MPENLGDATLRLRANSDRLKSDLDKARRNVDESARAMSKKLATVGLGFTAAGAAVLAPLAFAIKEASNLEESVNAVNVVFGEGGGTILDFGKIAATQVGIAQSEFNQLATQTGALLTNFGQTEQEAADTTLLLTNRAADLASVHNTDVKDALYAINSALRGETEAIRRYAADVTDASLEAYLFAKGIDGGVKSLTQSEKALLRVEALMYQTDKVQGDFQNTSASFANQTRILGATWKDLAATGGDVLLPVVSDMVYMVGQVAARVRVFTQENPKLFATLVKVSAVIGLLLIGIGALLLTMSLGIRVFLAAKGAALALASATKAVWAITRLSNLQLQWLRLRILALTIQERIAAAGKLIYAAATGIASAAATAFGVALTFALGPVGLIILAIAALIGIGILLWKNWDKVKEKAGQIWESVSGFVKKNWDLILAILFPIPGLPILIWRRWGKIIPSAQKIMDAVIGVFKNAWGWISGLWGRNPSLEDGTRGAGIEVENIVRWWEIWKSEWWSNLWKKVGWKGLMLAALNPTGFGLNLIIGDWVRGWDIWKAEWWAALWQGVQDNWLSALGLLVSGLPGVGILMSLKIWEWDIWNLEWWTGLFQMVKDNWATILSAALLSPWTLIGSLMGLRIGDWDIWKLEWWLGLWDAIKDNWLVALLGSMLDPWLTIGSSIVTSIAGWSIWNLEWWRGLWENVKANWLTILMAAILSPWTLIKNLTISRISSWPIWKLDWWKGLWGAVSQWWSTLPETIKFHLNSVIDVLNAFIRKWNGLSLSVPGFSFNVPNPSLTDPFRTQSLSFGGFSFNTPDVANIPYLAQGGIVTSPTLAMIGEKGPEAVLPLTGRGGMGGTQVNVNVEGNIMDGEDFIDRVWEAIILRSRQGLDNRFA